MPRRPQCAQRAPERGGGVPHRLRPLRAAPPRRPVVRCEPGAPAPLAGEAHLGAAAGALRGSGLACAARWLPPVRRCRRGAGLTHGRRLRFIYLLAVYLAAPLMSLVFLWRGLRDRSYWQHFSERFGLGAATAPDGVWIHAVSVGEVQACAPLVSALRSVASSCG